MMEAEIIIGDCRSRMPAYAPFDMILADPPYSDTSLSWDKKVEGWLMVAEACLLKSGSLWLFGSMRHLLGIGDDLKQAGFRYAQDIVWEKHNGSGFQNDRFKRVHEHIVQFYRDDSEWGEVFNCVQKTNDARRRTVRRKERPTHMGKIENSTFTSVDGGPRIRRSVIYQRSCHGMAIHPTEKPVGLLDIIIRTSCPDGGLVGDFFAGSGAVAEAAARAGRRYIGTESDPEMAMKANQRIAGLLL